MRKIFLLGMSVACLLLCASAALQSNPSPSDSVAATEAIYADVLDAYGAFSTIDSGLMKSYDGKDRQAWEHIYREKRAALVAHLAKLPTDGLSKTDARAVTLMRASLRGFPGRCFDSLSQQQMPKRAKAGPWVRRAARRAVFVL